MAGQDQREEDQYQATEDDKPDECSACRYTTDALAFYPADQFRIHEAAWLCDMCKGTMAGNAVMYPHSYREQREVLFAISYVGNVLRDEIRRRLPLLDDA